MVKLASTLPKEHERNGLEPRSRRLLDAYQSQQTIVVVALVRTKEVLSNEDFERIPKIELVSIEPAVSEQDDEVLRDILTALRDDRISHRKQTLDIPDEDETAEVESPLALEAGDVIDAEVVEDDDTALPLPAIDNEEN